MLPIVEKRKIDEIDSSKPFKKRVKFVQEPIEPQPKKFENCVSCKTTYPRGEVEVLVNGAVITKHYCYCDMPVGPRPTSKKSLRVSNFIIADNKIRLDRLMLPKIQYYHDTTPLPKSRNLIPIKDDIEITPVLDLSPEQTVGAPTKVFLVVSLLQNKYVYDGTRFLMIGSNWKVCLDIDKNGKACSALVDDNRMQQQFVFETK